MSRIAKVEDEVSDLRRITGNHEGNENAFTMSFAKIQARIMALESVLAEFFEPLELPAGDLTRHVRIRTAHFLDELLLCEETKNPGRIAAVDDRKPEEIPTKKITLGFFRR